MDLCMVQSDRTAAVRQQNLIRVEAGEAGLDQEGHLRAPCRTETCARGGAVASGSGGRGSGSACKQAAKILKERT